MYKAHQLRTTFGSWDVEKVQAVVARSTFRVKMLKALHVRTTFGRSDVVLRGRRKGLCTWSKVSKTWGFCGISKNIQKRWHALGHLKRICKDAFSAAGAVQETCSSELLEGPGADFLREEVSQNCFVFDDVNFENSGSLAELFRFWCCQVQSLRKSRRLVSFLTLSSQVQKLRKSRRIALFWILPSSKIEEVSQNCCVFKLAVRQTDRQAGRQTDREIDGWMDGWMDR